jgi:hypothetical protein
MTDRELILNFLNKDYAVFADNDMFKIRCLNTKRVLFYESAVSEFKTIIGSFITTCGKDSIDLFIEWFNDKKKELSKKIYDFLEKIKKNEGSIKILSKLKQKFKESEYSKNFIVKIFIDYYIEKYTKPMIIEFTNSLKDSALGSIKIYEDFKKVLDHETQEVADFAYDYLNEWYFDNIMEDKLKELFNEFIIILGEKNWVVRWIGHGTLTNEKLLDKFRNENDVIHKLILNRYDKWYDENIIKASEKIVGYC